MANKENKSLIKINNIKDAIAFLRQPAVKIAKVLPGILASGRADLVLSTGRLVQALIESNLLKQLGQELEYYIKKGEIKKNYFASNKNQASLYELLKFIDSEIPDEERFKAMKSIFLASVSKNASEKDEELAYEFMQIVKRLSGGEILILKAAYDIANKKFRRNTLKPNIATIKTAEWFVAIARHIGHGVSELVERHESSLSDLKLISKRNWARNSNVPQDSFERTSYFRLTPLGCELCKYITKYE